MIEVQFKKADGTESRVYRWACERVEENPILWRAGSRVDGIWMDTAPVGKAFTINAEVSSRTVLLLLKGRQEGVPDTEFGSRHLFYSMPLEEGYLFESEELDWNQDFPSADYLECLVTDISGQIVYSSMAIHRAGLYLDQAAEHVYTNQKQLYVSGGAIPNTAVTVSWGDRREDTTADEEGRFTLLMENLEECVGQMVQVQSGEEEKTFLLTVDFTKPEISNLKAVEVADGNVIISWDCSESGYFRLWKNGVLIEERYTEKQYTNLADKNAEFQVVAVDWAGNESEPKTVAVGDLEVPTAPGNPVMGGSAG